MDTPGPAVECVLTLTLAHVLSLHFTVVDPQRGDAGVGAAALPFSEAGRGTAWRGGGGGGAGAGTVPGVEAWWAREWGEGGGGAVAEGCVAGIDAPPRSRHTAPIALRRVCAPTSALCPPRWWGCTRALVNPPPSPVLTRVCPNTATLCFRTFGHVFGTFFFADPIQRRIWFVALCRPQEGSKYWCQSVGVAVIPCARVLRGVCWPVGHPFVVMKGWGVACACNMCSVVRAARYQGLVHTRRPRVSALVPPEPDLAYGRTREGGVH